MGFLTDVASVNQVLESRKSGDFEDRVKTVWANLVGDGDSAKVTPLQELDASSPNYNEKLGTALFVLEHTHPDDFKKSAECTIDEGACYGCEKGWYQKVVLYLNVLFDDGKNEPYVAVLNKGTGKNSVGKQLLDIAGDTDFDNSISDKLFKFTRSGLKKETSYSFNVVKKHTVKLEKYADQLFDLTQVPFKVKYEKQEAYYTGGVPVREEPVAATAAGVDQDW